MSLPPTVDVMISINCATMLSTAEEFKKYLLSRGFSVFLCNQMHAGLHFRDEISRQASSCKVFIPFMNAAWCKSRECDYEYNIALRTRMLKGSPLISPILLEPPIFYIDYPSVYGFLCSINGLCVKADALGTKVWDELISGFPAEVAAKADTAAADSTEPTATIAPAEPTVTIAPAHYELWYHNGSVSTAGKFTTIAAAYEVARTFGGKYAFIVSQGREVKLKYGGGAVDALKNHTSVHCAQVNPYDLWYHDGNVVIAGKFAEIEEAHQVADSFEGKYALIIVRGTKVKHEYGCGGVVATLKKRAGV